MSRTGNVLKFYHESDTTEAIGVFSKKKKKDFEGYKNFLLISNYQISPTPQQPLCPLPVSQ
jgi:hypothetical protein